eukprot:gene4786-5413_t
MISPVSIVVLVLAVAYLVIFKASHSSAGSFFERIHGEEQPDASGGLLKREFFQCDRRQSCTHVVQLRKEGNDRYKTIHGDAEMRNFKDDAACVWKKHYASPPSKEKVCNPKALGMESKNIPDGSITASSQQAGNKALYARLNGDSYWMPSASSQKPYLQVDLGKIFTVTDVATQGGGRFFYVKSYQVSYKIHGNKGNFKYVEQNGQKKIFSGNSDVNTVKKNNFSPPFTARYIRIYLIEKQFSFAFRAEFFGCEI